MKNINDYPGKCYRHQLRFRPIPSFDNNCPACWWEGEALRRPTKDAADKANKPDENIIIQNIGNGRFRRVE